MSDVVAIALISAIGSVVIAVTGVLAQYWGPEWRADRERRRVAKAARDTERTERALEYFDVLAKKAHNYRGADIELVTARAKLVAVLGHGERPVETFLDKVQQEVRATNPVDAKLRVIDRRSGQLFGWLRGEHPISSLEFEGVRPGVVRIVSDSGPTVEAEIIDSGPPRET
ncbi:MAG TPA: hypothetical protein VIP82_20910 [Microbacterium sp.]|uniref:hypothetical protein n=1 Tax=Microbacterium sp. TaxID=51671 RepID=UPI002F944055